MVVASILGLSLSFIPCLMVNIYFFRMLQLMPISISIFLLFLPVLLTTEETRSSSNSFNVHVHSFVRFGSAGEGRARVAKNRYVIYLQSSTLSTFFPFQIGFIMLISFLLCNCEYIGETVAKHFCAWKNRRKGRNVDMLDPSSNENNGKCSRYVIL
jgi:hypothetical protein